MVHTIVWRVGSAAALDFWEQRLQGEAENVTRSGESLTFEDPEGVRHELRAVETGDPPLVARHPEIPEEHALQGFDGVRAYAVDPERSTALLEDTLGFSASRRLHLGGARRQARRLVRLRHGARGTRHPRRRDRAPRRVGDEIDEQDAWQERVAEAGHRPTPVIDRFYFKSIYFREPNGILFELATLGPGFATDEDPEHLGERLSLPPDFEHLREQIEPRLTPLPNPRG